MARLLIIAPNPPFRHSLRFALEAEGHDVTVAGTIHDSIPAPSAVDCTIVDHHGLEDQPAEARSFVTRFQPVILLANSVAHPLAPMSFRTLAKPLLGQALSDAVQSAVKGAPVP